MQRLFIGEMNQLHTLHISFLFLCVSLDKSSRRERRDRGKKREKRERIERIAKQICNVCSMQNAGR